MCATKATTYYFGWREYAEGWLAVPSMNWRTISGNKRIQVKNFREIPPEVALI
jgi:hypothetical protein